MLNDLFFVKGKPRQIIKLFQKIDFYCSQSPGMLLKKYQLQKGASMAEKLDQIEALTELLVEKGLVNFEEVFEKLKEVKKNYKKPQGA